ncbi:MAG TPA: hypothetical protein VK504_17995 [Vicinamibacterales bacterium]|nr:hypothetical protein [Vicinamibacterales bacterium]
MTSRGSTFHVVIAGMLGAFACSSIAIWAHYHIGFGIVAGLIVGYLAYDFRSVLTAIPVAFAEFRADLASFRRWLYYSDPFLGPATLAFVLFSAYIVRPLFRSAFADMMNGSHPYVLQVLMVVFIFMTFIMGSVLADVMTLIAGYGASRWENVTFYFGKEADGAMTKAGWNDDGRELKVVPKTYLSVFRWTLEGFASIASGLLWRIWPPIFGAVIKLIALLAVGLWKLFLVVHRYERLLCAIDGTLGGVLSYRLFIRPERTFTQNALAVLFGMVLGAGWGVLNYEILSKHVLKRFLEVPITAPANQ